MRSGNRCVDWRLSGDRERKESLRAPGGWAENCRETFVWSERSQRRQTTCSTLVNIPSVASKMSIWYKFEASRNAVLHMHVDIFFYCEIPRVHTKTGQYIMHFSQIVLSNKIIRSMLVWLYKKHIHIQKSIMFMLNTVSYTSIHYI